jgi:CheY-specific phosphatase CheX
MARQVTADEWLEATVGSASEFAATTLHVALSPIESSIKLPVALTGCFVALIGEEGSIQIGLAANALGCQSLAQALFESSEALPEEDVTDALGEIANIIAGGVKVRLSNVQPQLAIGLPIVMDGHLRLSDRQQLVTKDIQLGTIPIRLLILCTRA